MRLLRPCEAERRSSPFLRGERNPHSSFSRHPLVARGLSNLTSSCPERKVRWIDPSSSLSRSVDLLVDQGTDEEAVCPILLRRCKAARSLSDGRRIHHHLIRQHNCLASSALATPHLDLLLQMYCKCAAFETVLGLFHRADLEPDLLDPLSYSAVMRACVMNGEGSYAVQLFTQLPLQSVLPGKPVLATVFSVFAHMRDMPQAKRVHACVIHSAYQDDTIVTTSIVSMYGKCGNANASRLTFAGISRRDSAAWDAMIAAASLNKDAFFLFSEMQKERILPTENTLAHLLNPCLYASLEDARLMHSMLMEDNVEVSNRIVALLVSLYGVFGSLEDSQGVFDVMCSKKSVDSWNALFGAYAKHGRADCVLGKLKEMQERGVQPDELTFVAMLSTCMNNHSLTLGEGIHGRIIAKGLESSVTTRVGLLEMYGRCGDLGSALKLFRKFPSQATEIWTAMMVVYTKFGLMNSVFALFDRMQQEACIPNENTYKCIFDACEEQSHVLSIRKVYAFVMFQSIIG